MPSTEPRDRNVKRATAEAQRRAMNERRHEYTNRIRKAKKSHLVTLKRRYRPPTTPPQAPSALSTTELAWDYIRSKSPASLAALQSALARSSDTTLVLDAPEIIPNEDTPAMQLANTLAFSLASSTDHQVVLMASRVITNLAAMEQKSDDEMDNYYERRPLGWCEVLIHSQALPALVRLLTGFATTVDPSYMSSDSPVLESCQQCCWAVGNLAGDSQPARDACRQAGVVPPLVTVLKKGMELKHTCICRNAAWALSNLTRGVTTSGKEFCGPTLLTPALVASVLMSPEQQLSKTVVSTWWLDVANEMCWVLAFLTAREDEVVDFLCQPTNELAWLIPTTQNVVCAALSHRLQQATRAVRSSHKSLTALEALRMTIPCLRSIGNIATADRVNTILQEASIVESLAVLIDVGSMEGCHGDVASVAVEAAWAAGTLLCDAGLPEHASTTIAAKALLPVLSRTVVSEFAKLDLKREALSALWRLVAAPPAATELSVLQSSLPARDEYLVTIAGYPGMVVALTELITSVDADASLASVQLVNALLRRLNGGVRAKFEEANIVDALEAVCDRESSNMSYGAGEAWPSGATSTSADICADLIDDFFGDEMNQEVMQDLTFGVPDNQMTFDFSQPSSQAVAFPETSSSGVGRGRGKPLPSWMQQTQG